MKNYTDYKKTLKNIGWMSFERIFSLCLSLFVTLNVANSFGKEQYGNYQYVVSIIALLEISSSFLDGRILKKHFAEDNPDSMVLCSSFCFLAFSVFSGIIGIVISFLAIDEPLFRFVFIVLIIDMIVRSIKIGMTNRFEFDLESRKVVMASNASSVISSLLQVIIVKLGAPILCIALAVLASSSINLTIIFFLYKRNYTSFIHLSDIKNKRNVVLTAIKESLPFAIATSCSIIYSRCDSVMVGSIISESDVAIYAIAIKLVSVVQMIISPIRESVYPTMIRLFQTDKNRYKEKYIQITSVLSWIYFLGVLLSFWVLPFLFRFLSADYQNSFPVYKLYVIGTFFMYNAALRAGHLTLIKRGEILTITQIISVVVNVLLNYILIKSFGIYGAAISTVFTQGISLMFSNLFFGKEGRDILIWQLKAINPKYIFRLVKHSRNDKINEYTESI